MPRSRHAGVRRPGAGRPGVGRSLHAGLPLPRMPHAWLLLPGMRRLRRAGVGESGLARSGNARMARRRATGESGPALSGPAEVVLRARLRRTTGRRLLSAGDWLLPVLVALPSWSLVRPGLGWCLRLGCGPRTEPLVVGLRRGSRPRPRARLRAGLHARLLHRRLLHRRPSRLRPRLRLLAHLRLGLPSVRRRWLRWVALRTPLIGVSLDEPGRLGTLKLRFQVRGPRRRTLRRAGAIDRAHLFRHGWSFFVESTAHGQVYGRQLTPSRECCGCTATVQHFRIST